MFHFTVHGYIIALPTTIHIEPLFFIVNGFARVKLFFALLKGLFGRFDFSQPVLFEFQVFRDFIAGFLLVGLVFFLVAAVGFFNQVINFSAQSLFLSYIQRELDLLHLWHVWILEQAGIEFIQADMGHGLRVVK